MTDPTPQTTAGRVPLRGLPLRKDKLQPLTLDLGSYASTGVLFANQAITGWLIDPQQDAVLTKGLRRLLKDPAVDLDEDFLLGEALQFLQARQQLGRLPAVPGTLAELADLLRPQGTAIGDTGLIPREVWVRIAVTQALEKVLEESPEQARSLHELHDAAFREDALLSMRLVPLAIGRNFGLEVRSVLELHLDDLTASELGDSHRTDQGEGSDDGHILVVPNVKRGLLRPVALPALEPVARPAGWQADSPLLVGLAFHDLVRKTESYVDRAQSNDRATVAERGLAGHGVDQLVATYPVVTPPAARAALRTLLHDALAINPVDIKLRYDEATAAALYFLMRGFGGDQQAGLAEFRARAERLPDRPGQPPTWRRIMLVVDIGGGTTDIALLAVDLEQVERPAEEQYPAMTGSHYLLRPRVLGSTGHPQLGGELITLRVFHWLKAALVDAMVEQARQRGASAADTKGKAYSQAIAAAAADPDWTPLVPQLVAATSPEPVPLELRPVLRRLMPTHTVPTADGAELEPGPDFKELWQRAEAAKIRFFEGDPEVGLGLMLSERLSANLPFAADLAALPEEVVLVAADFEQLVQPVVDTAVRRAADLARGALQDPYPDRIDLVALSGRTTGTALVRRQLRDRLDAELRAEDGELGLADGSFRPLAWNPAHLTDAGAHAKQAAALGAAWANSLHDYHAQNRDYQALGLDLLDVHTENLLLTLPAAFGLATNQELPTVLLRAGTPMEQCDRFGWYFLRSRWARLVPSIDLHRFLSDDQTMRWGGFRYLGRTAPEGFAEVPDDVWYQIELDQELTPTILLCRGTPAGVRPLLHPSHRQSTANSKHQLSVQSGHLESEPLRLTKVPGALDGAGRLVQIPRITARPLGSTGDPVEVFGPGPVDGRLDVDFADDADIRRTTAGTVSPRALPTVGSDHQVPEAYEFFADTPGGPIPLGELPVERADTAGTTAVDPAAVPAWALLDGHGRLRVHHSYPAYVATGLDGMLAAPGYVHRAAMDPGGTGWLDAWDPYCGDH
ncbi:hypothetical protein AB0K51_17115 [Kitasatospora sp. NPDC049285]|uniref:hypothetical protein n=1 Tax=Kitasatospora sp. NPDC049285 TaxID=3157096 RepID=UPI00342E9E31